MAHARTARVSGSSDRRSPLRRAFDWTFRDRSSGRIVVAQVPNLPLAIFLVAAGVRAVFSPSGALGTVISAVAAISLLWWGADEVARGVNPFRRALGGVVIVATAAGALLSR